MPKISIIIPIYNGEKYISRCLDSILNQTFSDYEIVIVDDGSTDSTAALCDKYALEDKRIKVTHSENGGSAKARNIGIELSSPQSEFLSFIDIDDWLAPNMYEELISNFRPEQDIVYCNFTKIYQDSEIAYNTFEPGENIEECISNLLLDGHSGTPWNKLFRRALIINNNIRFRANATADDLIFVCESFSVSRGIGKVNKYLYFYDLRNTSNITSTIKKEIKESAYLDAMELIRNCFESSKWGNRFYKEICWRAQVIKTDWVLVPEKYEKYHSTWPDSKKYTLSNPYLHKKMKIAMWMLDHHISLPLRIMSLFKKS